LNGTILIYGATGYTGKLIAKAAADQAHAPFRQGAIWQEQSVAFVAIGIKLALIVLSDRYV
jgi:short subunit dehydrogenase-like uncharacterized protein